MDKRAQKGERTTNDFNEKIKVMRNQRVGESGKNGGIDQGPFMKTEPQTVGKRKKKSENAM